MVKKGFFITFEGSDGCGKTTQSILLIKKLKNLGYDVVHTREPGGTIVAETLRKILLNSKNKISPIAELLLYEAGRAQHTEEIIVPAIKLNKIVICERYTDATIAYQGFGRHLDVEMIMSLNKIATNNLEPNITIYLDLNTKKSFARIKLRKKDRLENESLLFHKRVRDGYAWLVKKFQKRFIKIDANASIEKISECVFDAVKTQIEARIT
ncbi:MAG: dTMP kinase [Elusimicrobiota bacterium]